MIMLDICLDKKRAGSTTSAFLVDSSLRFLQAASPLSAMASPGCIAYVSIPKSFILNF